ncbi:hypothetical protein LWI29_020438 [Acer saccharum]|uniref:Uncharacterized protein n=1 Tax=Acer saccharum TaxID=4024 RepID=A0AA39VYG1_ACESA|nr:hypothetical protein LWI29_020438 [Acer saccharum]
MHSLIMLDFFCDKDSYSVVTENMKSQATAARRMKSVVEASRKEALLQETAGITPPQGDSDESSLEDPPEEEHNEDIPEYTPQETRGAGEEADLAGDLQNLGEPPADEAATQTDSLAHLRLKGKEKVGEPSEPVALSHGTSSSRSVVNEPDNAPRDAETAREPFGAVAPKILVPPKSVPVLSSAGGDAELRHPDPDSEDLAADLNTCGRQFGKRKASILPGRPTPKIPRMVTYVDSSSGDESDAVAGQKMTQTPPWD